MVEHFPNSTIPLPPLLTSLETVKLLRLDIRVDRDGSEGLRAPGDSLRSLDRLVSQGHLQPRRFGKYKTFSREAILRLIEEPP